jgi:hypothetical protein
MVAAMWFAAVGAGIYALASYETTAGETAAAPMTWPATSRLPRGDGFTVVMFLHRECPCSRASLAELDAVRGRATIVIVFDAAGGEMWERAGRMRATRVVAGDEAARFGAKTSGHTLVFDASGTLRFAGGITTSRGHVGENVGRLAVERVLAGAAGPSDHAVFGCALEAS